MAQNLNAEIITIGTEILLGELTDTNSVYMARVLRDLGINLYFMTSVGDNEHRIASAIGTALSRAQIVITCGGLGPTVDDKTRQAVAMATNRGLTFHQALLDQIVERFQSFGVQMTENNRQQAFLPEDALIIENPVGTAPSFVVEVGDGAVISLPGVPREMKFLMQERVIPYLRQRYQLGIIKAKTLKVAGIGESSLDDMIGRELLENGNPTIGLAAHHGEIDIRITAKAATEAEADQMIAQTEITLRNRVGKYIFGTNGDSIQNTLVGTLTEQSKQVVLLHAGIEAVTSQLLMAVPGGQAVINSERIYGHPDDVNTAFNVDQHVTLRELASQAAARLEQETGAQASIVVIGYPDIDEGSDQKLASVVRVSVSGQSRDRAYGFGGKSEVAKEWMSRWAMANLWRMLQSQDPSR